MKEWKYERINEWMNEWKNKRTEQWSNKRLKALNKIIKESRNYRNKNGRYKV